MLISVRIMRKFFKKDLGAKMILVLFLFNVVTSKSTGGGGAIAPADGTFTTYWEFQDPNAWLIDSLGNLRCNICIFLYNSSSPELCVEPCATVSAAAPALLDCSVPKAEAASFAELGGRLYTYHSKKLSWDDANAKCAELGMHLLIVDSSTELATVAAIFSAMATGDTWVGLKRINQNPDTYAWVDGTSVSVSFTNNGKECGIYDGSTLTAILCSPTKAYVCEREMPC